MNAARQTFSHSLYNYEWFLRASFLILFHQLWYSTILFPKPPPCVSTGGEVLRTVTSTTAFCARSGAISSAVFFWGPVPGACLHLWWFPLWRFDPPPRLVVLIHVIKDDFLLQKCHVSRWLCVTHQPTTFSCFAHDPIPTPFVLPCAFWYTSGCKSGTKWGKSIFLFGIGLLSAWLEACHCPLEGMEWNSLSEFLSVCFEICE